MQRGSVSQFHLYCFGKPVQINHKIQITADHNARASVWTVSIKGSRGPIRPYVRCRICGQRFFGHNTCNMYNFLQKLHSPGSSLRPLQHLANRYAPAECAKSTSLLFHILVRSCIRSTGVNTIFAPSTLRVTSDPSTRMVARLWLPLKISGNTRCSKLCGMVAEYGDQCTSSGQRFVRSRMLVMFSHTEYKDSGWHRNI